MIAREWFAVKRSGWAPSYADKIIAQSFNSLAGFAASLPIATAYRKTWLQFSRYAATPVVRAALKLAPMLLLRPGELRFAEWHEIDLDGALWTDGFSG